MPRKNLREEDVEERVCAVARRQGWFERKVKWGGRAGAPDRVFIKEGRTVWIEFKRPSGGHRKGLQIREGKRITDHGGEHHFCNTVELGFKILGLEGPLWPTQ